MSHADRPLAYARAHRPRFVEQLAEFVRFPSVSAQPDHAADIRRCATWLAGHMREIGLEQVQVVQTRRHPLVQGNWMGAPGRPTVLIYGHYDVQPAGPPSAWKSPPFEPQVRGDNLYGRGASDDKGQMFAHLKALEAYLCSGTAPPVNIRCLFEGEEEIGSPNLAPFVERHRQGLAADAAVISDTPIPGPGRPALTYALRGHLSLELQVHGTHHTDVHSGLYGGAVHNPLQALAEMLARLHDARGRVAIPGFYDRVRRWLEAERARMARTGPSDERIMADMGGQVPWGERGYTLYERTTIRPALTVNGLSGGYTGEGNKGIIPARASAKLSFRLVPDQDPSEIERLFRQYIARITPSTVRTSITIYSAAPPALVDRRHPALAAAAQAYRRGFGAAPVFLRSGGTIPVVSTFQDTLSAPAVLMGFALPDDAMHGPDEKFHLPNFYRGIETCIWFMQAMSQAR